MAYLDMSEGNFSGPSGGASRFHRASDAPAASPATFSALEWLVIALAERDRPASLAKPGRIAGALARLFGGGGQPRLANPRLEALRRFAVMAWHNGGSVAPSEFVALRASGFTDAQADTLLENIFRRRGGRRVGATA